MHRIIAVYFTIHWNWSVNDRNPDFEQYMNDLDQNHDGTQWVVDWLEYNFDRW